MYLSVCSLHDLDVFFLMMSWYSVVLLVDGEILLSLGSRTASSKDQGPETVVMLRRWHGIWLCAVIGSSTLAKRNYRSFHSVGSVTCVTHTVLNSVQEVQPLHFKWRWRLNCGWLFLKVVQGTMGLATWRFQTPQLYSSNHQWDHTCSDYGGLKLVGS